VSGVREWGEKRKADMKNYSCVIKWNGADLYTITLQASDTFEALDQFVVRLKNLGVRLDRGNIDVTIRQRTL
jgi:hypothetical protein